MLKTFSKLTNLGMIMSVKNKTKDRDINGRISRKYTGPSLNWKVAFPKGCPKSWRNMFMTRPKRRKNKQLCHQILKGNDYNELNFPLGNKKPHYYYW